MQSAHRQGGFTLVELLIVVIILGILAAVVIPQFSSAASESKESAVASNLATIRQAIEMYKIQHGDNYPSASIVEQLVAMTEEDGSPGSAYGPYIRSAFPKNAVNGLSSVTAASAMPGTANGSSGWLYATSTAEFRANVDGTGPSGVDYFDL